MSEETSTIEATFEQLSNIFTKWEADYRAEPEKFIHDQVRFCEHTPETYGELCANAFLSYAFGMGFVLEEKVEINGKDVYQAS